MADRGGRYFRGLRMGDLGPANPEKARYSVRCATSYGSYTLSDVLDDATPNTGRPRLKGVTVDLLYVLLVVLVVIAIVVLVRR